MLIQIFVKFRGFNYLQSEAKIIVQNLNTNFDRYYLGNNAGFFRFYVHFFKHFISTCQNSHSEETATYSNRFHFTNILRQLILRLRPLVLSDVIDISVQTLELIDMSWPLLYNQSMALEAQDINFSPNDSNNVMIPNSLASIAYEIHDAFSLIIEQCGKGLSKKFIAGSLVMRAFQHLI